MEPRFCSPNRDQCCRPLDALWRCDTSYRPGQSSPSTDGQSWASANSRVTFVDIDSIDWVEAEGNYARLHVGPASHVVRHTMTELLRRLGGRRFFRIHRSCIVNVDRVKELRVAAGGDYDVVLTSGTRVGLSRAYRDAFQARLAGDISEPGPVTGP